MEVFSTAVEACNIIYQILDASLAFPTESRSLAARFKYDARILQHFCDYFLQKEGLGRELSNDDFQLLSESTIYLGSLLKRVELCRTKLEAQTRWSKEVNRAAWLFRRNDLVELEKELYEWTKRLDLRLIALPEKMRTVMTLHESETEAAAFVPRVAIQQKILQYARKAEDAKKRVWEGLMITDFERRVVLEPPIFGGYPLGCQVDGKAAVVEYKTCLEQVVHDERAFQKLQNEIGEFVAALNFLDSTTTGLLKSIGFFIDPAPPLRFGLLHALPEGAGTNLSSLRDVMKARDASGQRQRLIYTLNQRLDFARKLATALFFIHSTGWVHKAVRSANILLLQMAPTGRERTSSKSPLRWALGSPYLIGFETARTDTGDTDAGSRLQAGLEIEIYQHPDRQGDYHIRYTMGHDIYSFGVVLLELGLWSPLEQRSDLTKEADPYARSDILKTLAKETELLMGRKFREIVQLCLNQGNEETSGNVQCIAEVLEKLEDLANSV
jgi:hypothetical protein